MLQDFLEVNGIDAMQPMTIAKGLAPELRDIRYANDSEIVWYEFYLPYHEALHESVSCQKLCAGLGQSRLPDSVPLHHEPEECQRQRVRIHAAGVQDALVDTYDCKFQLNDTLTDKEINALLKHLNPKSAVAEHLNFAKKKNEMGQDALWKLREEVKDTCKAINDLLHEPATRDAILKAQTEHQRDAMPMMDCGWLNWFPLEGTEFAEKFNTVRSTGQRSLLSGHRHAYY